MPSKPAKPARPHADRAARRLKDTPLRPKLITVQPRLLRKALLGLSLFAALLGEGMAQSYSRQQLQDVYAGHLRSESFSPEVTSAGNVRFRRGNRSYVIHVDDNDPLYFRLTLAFVSDDKSDEARARQLEACNVASSEVKVVKCFLDADGDPTFAVEMFLIVPGDFKASFARFMRATDSAYDRYSRKLSEYR